MGIALKMAPRDFPVIYWAGTAEQSDILASLKCSLCALDKAFKDESKIQNKHENRCCKA